MKRKTEFLLETWGGFYNEEYQKKHGHKSGYFWFDTERERDDYINRLTELEFENEYYCLMYKKYDGPYVRSEKIATAVLIYDNIEYKIEENFGFAYDDGLIHYMFDFECDCTLSLLIKKKYKDFKELDCGHEIKIKEIEIIYKERKEKLSYEPK